MDGTQEWEFLFFRHSVGLQGGLFGESQLPGSGEWSGSIEDEIIPLFPNLPGSNYKSFHEEVLNWLFASSIIAWKAKIKSPMDTQVVLASLAKGAGKEQVKGCFLTVSMAQHTAVVIVLKFMFFSFEDVSHIKLVHQQ
jgi:hypothetical protein